MTALTDGAIIKITLWVNGRSCRWATVREGLRRKKDKIKSVSYKLMHSATLTSFIIIFGESVFFVEIQKRFTQFRFLATAKKTQLIFIVPP